MKRANYCVSWVNTDSLALKTNILSIKYLLIFNAGLLFISINFQIPQQSNQGNPFLTFSADFQPGSGN